MFGALWIFHSFVHCISMRLISTHLSKIFVEEAGGEWATVIRKLFVDSFLVIFLHNWKKNANLFCSWVRLATIQQKYNGKDHFILLVLLPCRSPIKKKTKKWISCVRVRGNVIRLANRCHSSGRAMRSQLRPTQCLLSVECIKDLRYRYVCEDSADWPLVSDFSLSLFLLPSPNREKSRLSRQGMRNKYSANLDPGSNPRILPAPAQAYR